jgi:carboxypeptidase C (cathepsin A)
VRFPLTRLVLHFRGVLYRISEEVFGSWVALSYRLTILSGVLHGYHDLMSNYLSSRYLLEQTVRDKNARGRLSFGTYQGGHMFYLRTKSRAECAADVRSFFENSSTPQ